MSQDSRVVRRQAVIVNAWGLHLRPADKFVSVAKRFQSEIRVYFNGRETDGKSILDLSTLAADCGSVLEIEGRGVDAEAAVAALCELVDAHFYEDDEGQSVERPS